MKLFVERMREFITRDAVERAELLSKMGETRLLEAKSVSTVATELKIKLEDGEVKLEVDAKPPKIEIKVEKEKKEKNCKPHPVFEVHPGRGKKC